MPLRVLKTPVTACLLWYLESEWFGEFLFMGGTSLHATTPLAEKLHNKPSAAYLFTSAPTGVIFVGPIEDEGGLPGSTAVPSCLLVL
jgi:hypothetical protein